MKAQIQKCVNWNEQRYDQVFNNELAMKLLLEELQELHSADNLVDVLDAVGDISFVVFGIFWKLGFSSESIAIFFDKKLNKLTELDCFISMCETQLQIMDMSDDLPEASYPIISLALHAYFITCTMALRGIGVLHHFDAVVDCICRSNDTKEVQGKVDPSVKANINKGSSFVPPTADLTFILMQAQAEVKNGTKHYS